MKFLKEIKIASMISLGILSAIFLINPIKKNILIAEVSQSVETSRLQHQIDSLLYKYEGLNYTIGLKISSVDNGEVLYERNSRAGFTPASNVKLFTTGVALDKLGNDFTWDTNFYIDGVINDGVLDGDLYVVTCGDPTISRNILNKEPLTLMREWVQNLSAVGIRKINGSVVIDNSAFLNNEIGKGWKQKYQNYAYSARPSSFSVNENTFSVIVKATGKKGKAPSISIYPAGAEMKVINEAKISGKKRKNTIYIFKDPDRNMITVKGQLSRNKTAIQTFNMSDPDDFAMNILAAAFNMEKIRIKNGVSLSNRKVNTNGMQSVYTYHSIPLKDLVRYTNKKSNNFLANQVFLSLGYQLSHDSRESDDIIKGWLEEKDQSVNCLTFDDGSGLSPINLATPDQFNTVLLNMSKSPAFEAFYDSFPVAGVDGTLKNVMRYEPLYRNVRGKTGTIDKVKSLCGYLRTKDQEMLCFTILINDVEKKRYKVYDFNQEILKVLGNYSREISFAAHNERDSAYTTH